MIRTTKWGSILLLVVCLLMVIPWITFVFVHHHNIMFLQPSSSSKSSKVLSGYLWKRGVLFKQWKPRFFVLDTERHQVPVFSDCLA